MYEILTGKNFNEVIEQKQPWMNHDIPVSESNNVEPISDSEVMMLESIFDLYRTDNGYVSSKFYKNGDIVMSLYNDKDYQKIFENFGEYEPNVYIDNSTATIRALNNINPNTILSL